MISDKLKDALNKQIKEEIASAYLYLGMATHFEAEALMGFSHWMHLQAKEEWEHAMKLYHFLFELGATPVLPAIPEAKITYGDPKSVVEAVLEHERFISKSIHKLYELASEEKDYRVMSFLKWFIDEQVEEEDSVNAILDTFKYCDSNAGLMILDRKLSGRE